MICSWLQFVMYALYLTWQNLPHHFSGVKEDLLVVYEFRTELLS